MRFQSGTLFLALLLSVTPAGAATCPSDVPVVTIAPHQQGGFSWGNGVRPMGDPCVYDIAVDPLNDAAWYVGGYTGLYMTKTNGLFWTKPLLGHVGVIHQDPSHHLVYVGIGNKLYLTRDQGEHWLVVGTYNATVKSVLTIDSTLYVGLGWSTHAVPSGVYRSNLGGGFSTFLPFGAGHTGLIVWTLAYDAIDGVIYAGTEIFDHQPEPYKPKFFRSANGGVNWTNVQGTMPTHVVDSAVRPSDGFLYALNESLGVYGSATNGSTWVPPLSPMGVGASLLMDPFVTTRLFAGRQKSGLTIGDGGAWMSTDAGRTFNPIGLPGATVGYMAFNGTRTKLYAAAYASGIYVSPMP
jgi:hypothetical protein